MKIQSVDYIKGTTRWDDGPRDGLPEIAMIGRSNVGKSSLINYLLGRKRAAHVSKTPGKTRLIHFFLINRAFYLVDLPGYGYARTAKSTQSGWGKMIEGYLAKRSTLAGVVLLIDIRRPDSPLDRQMRDWLLHHGIHPLAVATKGDKLGAAARGKQAELIKANLDLTELVVTSTLKNMGKAAVWQAIGRVIARQPDQPGPRA